MVGFIARHRRLSGALGLALASIAAAFIALWLFTDTSRWFYTLGFWFGGLGLALIVAASRATQRAERVS